jgi:methyl-accepting chemotaxis protein
MDEVIDYTTLQCWEAKDCPISRRNQCPAYPDQGRICFSVTGTLCRGEVQGNYMEKKAECEAKCDFFFEVGKSI